MVKETQATVYTCEKCGKRALYKSELATHEKNCGFGVKVKVGDRVLVSRGYRNIETAEVVNISAKKLFLKYTTSQNTTEENPSEGVKLYDEAADTQIKQLRSQADQFDVKSEDCTRKALALFRSLPSAWG